MIHSLLPRVKVNFTLLDLFNAIFIREKDYVLRIRCKEFFCKYYNVKQSLLVPSARDAIYELLVRLPQKKVIIPAYTCRVVNEAVNLSGKDVIYAENEDNSFNASYLTYIDGDSIVLATHQYGLPCDIERIAERCKSVGAVLIEDCATSIGTTVNGRLTGTYGDYAMVSFNMSKTLNVPPFGGVIISNDEKMLSDIETTSKWEKPDLIFKIKGLLKGFAFVIAKNPYFYKLFFGLILKRKKSKPGIAKEQNDFYRHAFSEWQASILYTQLQRLSENIQSRREVYSYYDKYIDNPLCIKPNINREAVCTRYAILVSDKDEFILKCRELGVDLDESHSELVCPPPLCKRV